MFLTKISFNNIRSFINKVEINLKHNSKNIAEELKEGKLLKKNGLVYTPIVSIGGPNSSGKTSTLESIFFALNFFNVSHYNANLGFEIDRLVKKIFLAGLPQDFNDFATMVKDFLMNSIKKHFFDLSVANDFDYYVKLFSKWFEERVYANVNDNNVSSFLSQIFEYRIKFFQNEWVSLKTYVGSSSFIKLEINDEKFGLFQLSAYDLFVDGKPSGKSPNVSLNIEFIDKKNTNFKKTENFFKSLDEILNRLFIYAENIHIYDFFSEHFEISNEYHIPQILSNLIHNIGKNKTLRLLKLCDSTITGIDLENNPFNPNIYNVITLSTDLGVKKSPKHLSEGSKKFLSIMNLLTSIPAKSGMVLIDELDNCMHNKLVDFFKIYIQNLSTKIDIQLIYTSHNPICLASMVSGKQIYMIEKFENDIAFKKLSSNINKNNSVLKTLIEEKIGSHPSTSEILDLVLDLVFPEGD